MINWTEIKKRYLQGERPKTICLNYDNLDVKQIYSRAKREKWKKEKETLHHAIGTEVLHELNALKYEIILSAIFLLQALRNDPNALNPLLHDKSSANPYTLKILEKGVGLLAEKEKTEVQSFSTAPQFIGLPGLDTEAL
jgi:hypothetical protein